MRQTTQTNKEGEKKNKSNEMLNNDLLYFHLFLTELGVRYPRVHRLILHHPQGPRKNKIKNRQNHPTGS